MPYRRTIVSVFGRPIPVKKVEKPTKEQVIEIHTQYIAELTRCAHMFEDGGTTDPSTRIWEKYKNDYARQRIKELRII